MRGNVKDIFTVFDGTDKELIIPVYQRNYDWGEKQCERLYDDLLEVIRKDRPKHFSVPWSVDQRPVSLGWSSTASSASPLPAYSRWHCRSFICQLAVCRGVAGAG